MTTSLHRASGSNDRHRPKLGAGLLAAVLPLLGLAGFQAAPASAASGDRGYANQQTALRPCADTRCAASATVPHGGALQVWCWRDQGSSLGTVRWFRVSYGAARGFISANAVRSPQPSVPYCSDLEGGERLYAGQQVYSPDGRFRLIMQSDGNLVEYGPGGAWWSTMTSGVSGAWFTQQADGNGVVYNGSNHAVWSNNTMNGGARLVVQSDGNVVTYTGSKALYATSQHRWTGQKLRSSNWMAGGNCTWWAFEKVRAHIKRGAAYPNFSGNAGFWDNNGPAAGWYPQAMPTTHAVVVFEPWTNGTRAEGHVAWVESIQVRADGYTYLFISEMNWNGGFNKVSTRWLRAGSGMSYMPAPSL